MTDRERIAALERAISEARAHVEECMSAAAKGGPAYWSAAREHARIALHVLENAEREGKR